MKQVLGLSQAVSLPLKGKLAHKAQLPKALSHPRQAMGEVKKSGSVEVGVPLAQLQVGVSLHSGASIATKLTSCQQGDNHRSLTKLTGPAAPSQHSTALIITLPPKSRLHSTGKIQKDQARDDCFSNSTCQEVAGGQRCGGNISDGGSHASSEENFTEAIKAVTGPEDTDNDHPMPPSLVQELNKSNSGQGGKVHFDTMQG
ncbi:hypothetical protein FRB95_013815 [Tulasnella sp. JGI-2019a]|nr:hypothetical protein FRB95_013815 [Tulasnella sp. JGI-2019a]